VRDRIGSLQEVANALADNLPAPKPPSGKSRRRRRKKKRKDAQAQQAGQNGRPPEQRPEAAAEPAAPA